MDGKERLPGLVGAWAAVGGARPGCALAPLRDCGYCVCWVLAYRVGPGERLMDRHASYKEQAHPPLHPKLELRCYMLTRVVSL